MKSITITNEPKNLLMQLTEMFKKLMPNKLYDVKLSIHSEKRNINQNDLYWKLLTEYAKWGKQDINVLHNQMLSSYGVSTDYYAIVPEDEEIEKLSYIHLKRTSKTQVGKNGKVYVYCRIIKGSHELKKDEMSHLIDGLKNEIIGSGAEEIINTEGI